MRALEKDPQGLRRCRIDEWATVCDAPMAVPGRMGLDSHVCRSMTSLEAAMEYANHVSDAFEELGAPEQVFVVSGPTSTTRKLYEVVSASAGYSVLHATRPTWGKTLSRLLASMTRETRVAGAVPDPVAQDILGSAYVAGLEREIRRLEIGRLEDAQPLGAGLSSIALQLGDRVVRIGRGELPDRPDIPEVLQAEVRATLGNLRYEVLPKVETHGVTPAHLQALLADLAAKGYEWGDAGLDNIGLMAGRPVIFDSNAVRVAPADGEGVAIAHEQVRDPTREEGERLMSFQVTRFAVIDQLTTYSYGATICTGWSAWDTTGNTGEDVIDMFDSEWTLEEVQRELETRGYTVETRQESEQRLARRAVDEPRPESAVETDRPRG